MSRLASGQRHQPSEPPEHGAATRGRTALHDESGQSLAEMAWLLPLFAASVIAALSVADIAHEHLRAHEAARYAAFSLAHTGLSTYGKSASLSVRKSEAQLAVQAKTSERMLNARSSRLAIAGRSELTTTTAPAGFPYLPFQSASELATALDASGAAAWLGVIGDVSTFVTGYLIDELGFDGAPMIVGKASETLAFGGDRRIAGTFDFGDLGRTPLAITEHVSVIANGWFLGDGRDVWPGGYIGDAQKQSISAERSGLQMQTQKLYLARGVFERAVGPNTKKVVDGFLGAMSQGLSTKASLGEARVASKNYGLARTSNATLGPTGTVDVYEAAGVPSGETAPPSFDSTQMRDNAATPQSSRHVLGAQKRGAYFKGCNKPQQSRCDP